MASLPPNKRRKTTTQELFAVHTDLPTELWVHTFRQYIFDFHDWIAISRTCRWFRELAFAHCEKVSMYRDAMWAPRRPVSEWPFVNLKKLSMASYIPNIDLQQFPVTHFDSVSILSLSTVARSVCFANVHTKKAKFRNFEPRAVQGGLKAERLFLEVMSEGTWDGLAMLIASTEAKWVELKSHRLLTLPDEQIVCINGLTSVEQFDVNALKRFDPNSLQTLELRNHIICTNPIELPRFENLRTLKVYGVLCHGDSALNTRNLLRGVHRWAPKVRVTVGIVDGEFEDYPRVLRGATVHELVVTRCLKLRHKLVDFPTSLQRIYVHWVSIKRAHDLQEYFSNTAWVQPGLVVYCNGLDEALQEVVPSLNIKNLCIL